MWNIRQHSEHIPNLKRYHSIDENWAFSAKKIGELQVFLNDRCSHFGSDLTIAVAGSLGRFEAAKSSDLDCLVLADDPEVGKQALSILREAATKLEFSLPKSDGVFSEASSISSLIEDLGSFSENLGALDDAC